MSPEKKDESAWITEKYVSPHVFPKEDINLWLKWKSGLNFDKLILAVKNDRSLDSFFMI